MGYVGVGDDSPTTPVGDTFRYSDACHPEPQAKDLRLFLKNPFDPTYGDNRQAHSHTNRGLSRSRPRS